MKYLLSLILAAVPACSSPSLHVVAEQPQEWSVQSEVTRPAWLTPVFFRAITTLVENVPLDAPLKIEVLSLEGKWGQAWWNEATGHYHIQLDSEIPGPALDWAIDVLIHEWAHCVVLGAASWEDPHDAMWGVALARCYRAIVDPEVSSPEENCNF